MGGGQKGGWLEISDEGWTISDEGWERGSRGGGWFLVDILWQLELFLLIDRLGNVAQLKGWMGGSPRGMGWLAGAVGGGWGGSARGVARLEMS